MLKYKKLFSIILILGTSLFILSMPTSTFGHCDYFPAECSNESYLTGKAVYVVEYRSYRGKISRIKPLYQGIQD